MVYRTYCVIYYYYCCCCWYCQYWKNIRVFVKFLVAEISLKVFLIGQNFVRVLLHQFFCTTKEKYKWIICELNTSANNIMQCSICMHYYRYHKQILPQIYKLQKFGNRIYFSQQKQLISKQFQLKHAFFNFRYACICTKYINLNQFHRQPLNQQEFCQKKYNIHIGTCICVILYACICVVLQVFICRCIGQGNQKKKNS
eukprot:TRINITY_DN34904_c0_g1_i2.p1 TRINITY_DN34904_c0_g1~~TRINITY_DN34904_c0_g1_i2.p1  ORF type:complete len:199 (+),score=-17.07 TRINITY_DN34904_c0_g1_i2:26-622(+)